MARVVKTIDITVTGVPPPPFPWWTIIAGALVVGVVGYLIVRR